MKKVLLLFLFVTGGFIAINAQTADTLVTFETTADTTGWMVFANGESTATDILVVENPDKTGENPTDSALMFTVNPDSDPWAGMIMIFTGDSAIAITEENHIFTMQVFKTSISNVGLKLEQEIDGGSVFEVLVPNLVVDQWETITFDFSERIGDTFEALAIFPDFPDMRTEGSVVYIDNIVFGEEAATSAPLVEQAQLKVYPTPATDMLHIQHQGMTGYIISNTLGQEVERSAFGTTDQITVDITRLRTGIHFLSVESDKGITTTRFIKK
ncbi:MAG: T9SS type A sorting domain-containing protein [Mariniphaga sp.]